MRLHLLPAYFKRIGLISILISVTGVISLNIFIPKYIDEYKTILEPISQSLIIIGLLLIVLSKGKIEDEYIDNCRLKAFAFAFIATSVNGIFHITRFIESSSITSSAFNIISTQLLLYLAMFYFLKSGIIKFNRNDK